MEDEQLKISKKDFELLAAVSVLRVAGHFRAGIRLDHVQVFFFGEQVRVRWAIHFENLDQIWGLSSPLIGIGLVQVKGFLLFPKDRIGSDPLTPLDMAILKVKMSVSTELYKFFKIRDPQALSLRS